MRWHRLPLLVLLVAVVPVAAATAAPARAGSGTDACPTVPALAGVHGSAVPSVGAADAGGVYVTAAIRVVECDARGDVYVTPQDATLVALDPATGAERWRFATGAPRMTPPVVADGLTYVIGQGFGNTDTLYAVDAATGEERWRFETGATFSAPVVVGGVVYAVGGAAAPDLGSSHLYALDAANGTERWRRPGVPPASTLAVDRDTGYVGFFDNCAVWHLAAFDVATGADRWSVSIETPTRNCPIAGPAVADGVAYLVGMTGEGARGNGYLAALDGATGDERWRWEFDPGGLVVTPVVNAGTVYVIGLADRRLTVHVVDAAGGTERWRFGVAQGPARAVAADGTVFVQAGAGDQAALYAVDAATGTERWRFPFTAPPALSEQGYPVPAVAAGVAYVGGGDAVYAVDAASGAERWRARLAPALPASTPDAERAERAEGRQFFSLLASHFTLEVTPPPRSPAAPFRWRSARA